MAAPSFWTFVVSYFQKNDKVLKKSFANINQSTLPFSSGRGDVVRDDRGSKDAAASLIFLVPIFLQKIHS